MKKSLFNAPAVALSVAVVLFAGCPLPFQYNGKGSGGSHTSDPSTPSITAPVTVTYTDQGGHSGVISDGGSFSSGHTTTVTLSTTSLNAVIFYTTDGTPLENLRNARKISASSGSFTVTRTTDPQALDIRAVAVGSNMLPSPSVHAAVSVSPYPFIMVTRSSASIPEEGGTATYTLTSSIAPATPLTVNLQATGTYHEALLAGIPAAKGATFTKTIPAAATTTSFSIGAQLDPDNMNETIALTIIPDSSSPPAYSVGTPSSASVQIQDNNRPVVSIAAGPAAITDNGGVTTFTVTPSFAPTAPLTVNLATGGAYKPGDQDGLPPLGTAWSMTLAPGQTSLTWSVTAHPDLGEYLDQELRVTLMPDDAYTIGGAGSAAVTVTDTSPIPVLTLAEDRTSMTDVQAATFTVHANVAPEVDQAILIASSGFTPGQVTVPSSVVLPAGATSATFLVSALSQAGYQVQNPQVSILAGTGHTIGTPGTQGLLITDDIVGITYAGMWGFTTGTGTGVGSGASWTLSGNVALGGGRLVFGGAPGDDALVELSTGGVDFDKNHFTLAVKFAVSDLSVTRPIIAGGAGWRWIIAQADTSGALSVDFDNHGLFGNPPSFHYEYQLHTGLVISPLATYTLVMNVDTDALMLTAWLNGTKVTVPLPAGFAWENLSGDENLTATDYSTGRIFKGTWDWVFAVNGLLGYDTVVSIAAGAGL